TLLRPIANGCGCLGCISVSPERARQCPAKLGLSMPTCLPPSRWRPVTRVKDHHSSLAPHLWVGCRRFENERTNAVGSPTVEHPFDDRADVLDRRDELSSQSVHYLRVRKEVVEILRIL